jgi:hypothetical protein
MFLSIIYRADHSQQLRPAMFPDVCLVAEPVDGETETKANERLGMESFVSPEAPEDQIDHVNRLLEAEKSNTRELNEQLGKAVNEKKTS